MTLDEIKELTTWMRSQGVQQFSASGVTVVFHPKSIRMTGAEATQPATQGQPQERLHGLTLEELMSA